MFLSVFGVCYGLLFCALSCYMAVQIAKGLQTTTYIINSKKPSTTPLDFHPRFAMSFLLSCFAILGHFVVAIAHDDSCDASLLQLQEQRQF